MEVFSGLSGEKDTVLAPPLLISETTPLIDIGKSRGTPPRSINTPLDRGDAASVGSDCG